MNARVLLDTNVLVCVYDTSAPLKRSLARSALGALAESGAGAVSTQVLSEFFCVTSRRMLNPETALIELLHHARTWTVVQVTAEVVITAAEAVRDYRLNFWDAQIWATAKVNQIDFIFSEDFNSGSVIEGVRFVNPFAPHFHLPSLL